MVLKQESRHRLQQSLNETVFKNLLIADSGKGHVEEMVRMLRDLPGFHAARINLLHVVPEQGSAGSEELGALPRQPQPPGPPGARPWQLSI